MPITVQSAANIYLSIPLVIYKIKFPRKSGRKNGKRVINRRSNTEEENTNNMQPPMKDKLKLHTSMHFKSILHETLQPSCLHELQHAADTKHQRN
jgi:hypothetical protein